MRAVRTGGGWASAAAIVLAVAAIVGGTPGAASAGGPQCAQPHAPGAPRDVIVLRTMTVRIGKVPDYKVGSVAKVPVTVTRPSSQDPFQLGVPIPPVASVPASGATVGVGLYIGSVFAPGFAKSGSTGKAVVPIKIPRTAPATKVNVDAYAYNILVQAPCYTIQEDGYQRKNKVFKTTK